MIVLSLTRESPYLGNMVFILRQGPESEDIKSTTIAFYISLKWVQSFQNRHDFYVSILIFVLRVAGIFL